MIKTAKGMLIEYALSLPPLAATKPVEPVGSVGAKSITIFRERWTGVPLVANLRADQFSERLKPHENFEAIRLGKIGRRILVNLTSDLERVPR